MSFYSSADVAGDFDLVNFNIDRDRYILIPYIKAARQINLNLRIWASPWCPPAWMKTNNHYASAIRPSGEKDVNGLAPAEASKYISKALVSSGTARKLSRPFIVNTLS